ncbi:MAG TPA: acetyl-CoA synthetase [Firmicutes bacterium]|jgi:acyl-CoA synthetase (NDP forming)|nr:acetyl-CoA synthetase [Bacillota bacterium]
MLFSIEEAKARGLKNLTEFEAKEILKAAGIPVVKTLLARSKKEAQQFAASIGYPVAMKISSRELLHKTEAGGVSLDLNGAEEVGLAYDRMLKNIMTKYPCSTIEGVTIQPMISKGVEVVIGVTLDPQFGPMVMFGLGGIFVEILKDVSFRIVPLTEEDAYEMIYDIRGRSLLEGVRGAEPVKIEALAEILLKLSRFVEANQEIKELDINPLLADSRGSVAVDARIILK